MKRTSLFFPEAVYGPALDGILGGQETPSCMNINGREGLEWGIHVSRRSRCYQQVCNYHFTSQLSVLALYRIACFQCSKYLKSTYPRYYFLILHGFQKLKYLKLSNNVRVLLISFIKHHSLPVIS